MDYIAQPKDYWIAPNAVNITLNALGNPNRMQGSVVSGAAILCYIEGIDGLGYDNGHRFKTWPLSISPTYFNSNTEKYVYVAIPRNTSVGTQAVVVFPGEKLDIYGKNESDAQIGFTDYYYIWLQGIITATDGTSNREWQQAIDFGKKGTDEDLYDDTTSDWYQYSKVNELVTFLKNITMKAGTTFHNFFLGYKELTGVATSGTEYIDSDVLVATPGYVESQYLSKTHESEAREQIGFIRGLWVGVKGLYEITAEGIAKFKSLFADDIISKRIETEDMQSSNYTGDGITDTGWRLTSNSDGRSKLTVDELYVRMKAVFESLEVKKEMVTGGNQIFSRAANVISRTDYYNASDEVIGYSEVKVPWMLRGLSMVLGKRVLRGIYSKVRPVRIAITDVTQIAYIRCYFLAEEGGRKVNNLWSIEGGHDLARCQTFNLNRSERQTYVDGESVKLGNIFWWRKVVGVSSNSSPVEIEGKKYHYFDVSNQTGGYMAGSDLPCAGDEVSQWGNDGNEDRMHLVTIEVDGGVAIKAYEGIYTFDMSKCWYGGNPCKMNLSPSNEYRFTGRSFKIETEYGVRPVPVDIDVDWALQTKSRAEYAETGISVGDMIAKNYYYDRVPHNGSLWLCLFSGSTYWARYAKYDAGVISYVTEDVFNTLPDSQKLYVRVSGRTGLADNQVCRRQEYTAAEPGTNSVVWKQEVAKGANGIDAQDVEWVYIRTMTNVPPVILSDNTYIDSNGKSYTADDHLPHVSGNANIENNHDTYECTDDPKGVDDTWKYEWEIKRSKGAASDGHRTWQPYSGTMTLHNNLAESAFVIDTYNDNDQFGTDSNSEVLVQQVRSTSVRLYDGATPQQLKPINVDPTVSGVSTVLKYTDDGTSVPSTVAEASCSIDSNDNTKGIVDITFKTGTFAKSGLYAEITAIDTTGRSKQTVFTVRKVLSGQPGLTPIIYQLAPTQKSFSFSRTAGNALTPSSRSSQVNVAKTEGNTTNILSSAQTGISYQWGFDTNSIAEETGKAVGTTISITNTQANSHYQVWVELSTGDRETLPIVKDGASPNTNILLRTIFDKGIDFVKEKWTGDFNNIYIDGASDTHIEGHKCIRINASTLPTGEFADFNQNVIARVKPATWYTLSFNYFSTGGSTDKFLETFVWSGASGYTAIDVSEGMYIDGVHQSAAATRGDGCVQWPSDWTGKRHSVTFKTVGTFDTDYVNILFRCNAGGQTAVCMPKLEEGKTATAYMANDDDLVGKDAAYISLKGACHAPDGAEVANPNDCEITIHNGKDTVTYTLDDFAPSLVTNAKRGFVIVYINRQTLEIANTGTPYFFDTYQEATERDWLATAIQAAPTDYFVCLISYDAVGFSPALENALKVCGGTSLKNNTAVGRYPFAFIGYRGLQEGYAAQIEGDLESTITADAMVYVADGNMTISKNGEDAVVLKLSPENVIITQSTEAEYPLILTEAFTAVTIVRGEDVITPAASSIIATPSKVSKGGRMIDTCSVTVQDNAIWIDAIGSYDNKYFESGYVDISVTYNGKTYTGRFNFYCNLLGTWKQTIEGDVETIVAEKTTYYVDGEKCTVEENLGEYVRSSSQNISTLTKKVDGSKNLIPVTSGWEGNKGASVNYDADNFSVWDNDGDLYSPAIKLTEGNIFCFSAYMSDEIAENDDFYLCYGRDYTNLSDLSENGQVQMELTKIDNESITVDGNTYYRYYGRRNASSWLVDMFVDINYNGYGKIFCPQIELLENAGARPTPFSARSLEISSQIKQTAEGINIGITQGLQRTGVDITNGLINLIADKTTFMTSGGKPMISIQMCNVNGEVGTGPTYNIPSLVFYDGEIGNGGTVAWVLNYRGLVQMTQTSHVYKLSKIEGLIAFKDLGPSTNLDRKGMTLADVFSASAVAAMDWGILSGYYRETLYLYESGYTTVGDTKMYIPSDGPDYENRLWLTNGLTPAPERPYYNEADGQRTQDSTNAPASGYYFEISDRHRTDYKGGEVQADVHAWTEYNVYEINENGEVLETQASFRLYYTAHKITNLRYEFYDCYFSVNGVSYSNITIQQVLNAQ